MYSKSRILFEYGLGQCVISGISMEEFSQVILSLYFFNLKKVLLLVLKISSECQSQNYSVNAFLLFPSLYPLVFW